MQELTGISPLVDDCAGIICVQAQQTYRSISFNNQRWIDENDVIQDGLVAAVEAEGRYLDVNSVMLRQTRKEYATKFSTYLHRVLRCRYDDMYNKWLNQLKRRSSQRVIELDAPIGGVDAQAAFTLRGDMVEDGNLEIQADRCYELAEGFVRLCCRVSTEAVEFLVGGLIGGIVTVGLRASRTAVILEEIRHVIESLGLTYDELLSLTKSTKAQVIALTLLAGGVMMSTGLDLEARILECIECESQFSLRDLKYRRFDAETMTCARCYRKMRGADAAISCFGKAKTTEHEGYSETDTECRLHCMDRKACKQHLNKRGETNMAEKETTVSGAEDLMDGVDLSDVKTAKAKKPKSKSKANGHDPAPARKAASKKKAAKKVARPVKLVTEVKKGTLTEKLFGMLAKGTTRPKMEEATGWNDHSVRGFLSGAPKRYGVEIKATKTEDGRVYKLVGKGPAVAAAKKK